MSSTVEPSATAVKQIRAVHNACTIIEEVAARGPVGVSELARVTGLDKSAVQRIVVTLRSAGWIVASPAGPTRWEVSPANPLLRHSAVASLEGLARPAMDSLRDASGETVILVTRNDGRLVIGAIAESRRPVRVSPALGYALPWEGSATGAAIAASLPDDDRRLLQKAHPALRTRELERVRRNGWAANDGEVAEDVRTVAAALTFDGYAVGALAICGPAGRVTSADLPRLAAMVVDAVGRVVIGRPVPPR